MWVFSSFSPQPHFFCIHKISPVFTPCFQMSSSGFSPYLHAWVFQFKLLCITRIHQEQIILPQNRLSFPRSVNDTEPYSNLFGSNLSISHSLCISIIFLPTTIPRSISATTLASLISHMDFCRG